MKNNTLSEISAVLVRLGITANYTGFAQTSYAVFLAQQDPGRLTQIVDMVYAEVASHYGTTWKAVEHNIRTIIPIAWNTNRPVLEELAHRPLCTRPTVSQFISILAAYCSYRL